MTSHTAVVNRSLTGPENRPIDRSEDKPVSENGSTELTRAELKHFMRRSDRPGLVRLFWWCVLLVATGSLVFTSMGSLWLLVPAMFVHGIVVVHHFAIQHECTHYTAFKSRWICRLLTRLCGFILVIPPLFFRYEHSDHHRYTNLHGQDPEMIELPTSVFGYLVYLSALPYWYAQVGGLIRRSCGRLTPAEARFVPTRMRRAVVSEGRWMIAGYACVLICMWTLDWAAPLFYWWLPMLLAEPVMRFIRMTEHVGRPTTDDRRENTRTNVVSRPWAWLAWNMNYHAEHHFAVAVPFHALGRLHERLDGYLFVEPRGYVASHRDIFRRVKA